MIRFLALRNKGDGETLDGAAKFACFNFSDADRFSNGGDVVMKQKILWILGIVVLGALALAYPATMAYGAQITGKYALEMLWIFPPILVLMGIADVWVPKEAIDKYLGRQSGVKGILLSVLLGTLPTGPVYMAFPIAAELLRKKASVTNIMIFLGVWASLKIPQIGMEVQFQVRNLSFCPYPCVGANY